MRIGEFEPSRPPSSIQAAISGAKRLREVGVASKGGDIHHDHPAEDVEE
jgi:hypothetical protein